MDHENLGSCWKCGKGLDDYGRSDICPGCRSDTRACRNCIHYEESRNNQCREPAAESVAEKTKTNFCEFFKPGRPAAEGPGKKAAAKSAFDKLFKKP